MAKIILGGSLGLHAASAAALALGFGTVSAVLELTFSGIAFLLAIAAFSPQFAGIAQFSAGLGVATLFLTRRNH